MIDIKKLKYTRYAQIQNSVIIVYIVINNIHNIVHLFAKDYISIGTVSFNLIQIIVIASYFSRKQKLYKISEHLFYFSVILTIVFLNAYENNFFYKNDMILLFPFLLLIAFADRNIIFIYSGILITSTIILQYIFSYYTTIEFIIFLLTISVFVSLTIMYKLFVMKLECLHENTANEIFNSTFTILGSVAELKDKETHNHLDRVGIIVGMLLNKMENNPKYSRLLTNPVKYKIKNAAILHDIGKIAIPDHILMKRGSLNSDEFDIMKTHTTSGKQLLKEAQDKVDNKKIFDTAIEIAAHHHERWDGTGYPDKLKGIEIPLSARIMAVADVYDALVSERPYKKAFSYNEAYQIIKSGSGKHFDPEIVKSFRKIHNKLYERIKPLL